MEQGNPEETATQSSSTATEQEQIDYKKKYEEAEKRRRDTQAAYTRGQQELKMLKAEREALEKQIGTLNLTVKQDEELEDLKFKDPDAWRQRINELEQEAVAARQQVISQATAEARAQAELERRAQVLQEFNAEHPELQITDEVIANDIPPRITNKLERGEVTFEEFLEEAKSYLDTPKKVVGGETPPSEPDLGKVGGRDTASSQAVSEDIVASYQNEVY